MPLFENGLIQSYSIVSVRRKGGYSGKFCLCRRNPGLRKTATTKIIFFSVMMSECRVPFALGLYRRLKLSDLIVLFITLMGSKCPSRYIGIMCRLETAQIVEMCLYSANTSY